ncbi:hypothetical protein BDR26DRAFT_867018 [Obelidium mucronatum]|nr:hypothetical protein BDR26DRAFT_867018 [Obelidium mucronatum]
MFAGEVTTDELQAQIRDLERKLEQKRLQDQLKELQAKLNNLNDEEANGNEPTPTLSETFCSAADIGIEKKRKMQHDEESKRRVRYSTTTASKILATAYLQHQSHSHTARVLVSAPMPSMTHHAIPKKPKWEEESLSSVSANHHDTSYVERLKQHQLEFGGLDDVVRTSNFRDRVSSTAHQPTDTRPRYSDGQDSSVECFSGLRLRNRKVENAAFIQLLQSRQYIPLPSLSPSLTDADIQGDWVTVAVVIQKTETRISTNQKPFVIIRLGDLKSSIVINAFLFGRVFEKWGGVGGIGVGEVIGVLNPKILPVTEKSSLMGIDIDDPGKLLHLGTSLDSCQCKFVSKGNNPKECTTIVDGRKGRYCSYHMEMLFKKRKHARSEFSGGTGTTQIGSPTKPKKEHAQNEQASSYLLNDGFQVSTSLDVRTNLSAPAEGGFKGVRPLTKEQQAQIQTGGTRGDKYLRIARNLEAST